MRFSCKLAFAVAFLVALPLFAQQQQDSTPPPQQNAPPSKDASAKKPAKTPSQPQKKPSEADQNPFPETQSEAAAHQAAQQGDQSAPSAPAPQSAESPSSSQQGNKPSEADQNPFPATQSQKAAGGDQPQSPGQRNPKDQAPSSPSSGAPGQDDSSSKLPGFTPPPDLDSSKADEGDGTTADPALARKDTQVGRFYLQSGDYKGAYDRFAEAVRVDPGSADAVFGLADAARHLNRRGEAIRNYQLYLAALPDGPHAKDVRKALRDMGVSPNS
ncbi:MAG TPA: tetratricopeptide repeat protein [Acidobacteriaceae bacterium]